MPSPRGSSNPQFQVRLCPPLQCIHLPITTLAWCYPATSSHSKERGDAAPSSCSAVPTDISIIDLRETSALLGVCRCYQN